MNFLLKWIAVLAVMAVGIFFILRGLGVELSTIEYKGLKAHNVPAGLLIFAGGIVLAAVWKTERSVRKIVVEGGRTFITETVTKMFRGN